MEEHALLTEQIAKSLEVWTIISTYNIAMVLLLLGALLHFARGFFKDTRRYFRFNVSRDNWSILLNLLKDFSLFGSYGISLLLINPDMFADVKFPMPFFPLGVIFLGIALIYKIRGDLTQSSRAQKLFALFLLLAVIVQYFGFVFVMEAAPEEWVNAGVAGDFWLSLRSMRSNLNPSLSMWSFILSFPVLVIITGLMIYYGYKAKFYKEEEE